MSFSRRGRWNAVNFSRRGHWTGLVALAGQRAAGSGKVSPPVALGPGLRPHLLGPGILSFSPPHTPEEGTWAASSGRGVRGDREESRSQAAEIPPGPARPAAGTAASQEGEQLGEPRWRRRGRPQPGREDKAEASRFYLPRWYLTSVFSKLF